MPLTWSFHANATGYKVFKATLTSNAISGQSILTKYNGIIIPKVANENSFTAGDQHYVSSNTIYISVSNTNSGFGESYTPTVDEIKAFVSNGWQAKTVDGNGKPTAWRSLVDGTDAPTQTLAYVRDNMAPRFTPYKLSYVLATPQTIVVTDKVEGDLVVNGATQVEIGSGCVIKEKITPTQHSSTLDWYINEKGVSASVTDNPLKYRVSKILGIYRNGILDSKWTQATSASNQNGTVYATIKNSDYDSTAEYTVTYLLLDRHLFTTNILSVTANYDASLKSVVDDVVAKQSDIAAQVSVNVRAIAELYKRIKALGG